MTNPPRVLTWNAVSTKLQDAEDKFSIDYQLKLNRAVAERLGGVLVEDLIVRGFSREYWTLADVVAATDDTEVDAFRKLWRHIQARDFDYFVCFEADRFGRTPSLVHEVIGRITRDVGADIITTFDNVTMNERNAVMIGSIKAISARQGIEKLVEWHDQGMDKRARDGRSTSGSMPLFHVRLRDAKGKEYAVGVNEELRSLWTNLADVILERVAWEQMETVLFERHGYGNNGAPFNRMYFRGLVMNPSFWGNTAKRKRRKRDRRPRLHGPWRWDSSVPPPKGVTVYYGARPAIYSGVYAELGERVKQELWRRHNMEGSASPTATFRFHGLVVCSECGYTLSKFYDDRSGHTYLRCGTRWRKGAKRLCTKANYVRADEVQAYLHEQIENRLAGRESAVFDPINSTVLIERRLADEQARLDKNESRLRSLIVELQDAPDTARAYMRQQMGIVSEDIDRARASVVTFNGDIHSRRSANQSQEWGFLQLREHGVDWLWQQQDGLIHQILTAILVDTQVVAQEGELIGVWPSDNKALLTWRKYD